MPGLAQELEAVLPTIGEVKYNYYTHRDRIRQYFYETCQGGIKKE